MRDGKRLVVLALKAILPLATVAASAAAAHWLYRNKPAPPQQELVETAPAVTAMRVEKRPVRFPIRSQGTVEPRRETTLAARVSGQLELVADCFHKGGFFREGDLLVQIDQRDYRLRTSRLEASLRSARAQLAESQQDVKRKLSLRQHHATTEAELQQAQTAVEVGEATIAELEAQLAEARHAESDTRITAPFDGCIREKFVEVGQFVTVGTRLASCFSTDAVEVRLPIGDDEFAFLNLPLGATLNAVSGPEVVLEADFAGRRCRWQGRIVRSEAMVDARSRMVYLVAQIPAPYDARQENGGQPLAVGMFVEATIHCPPIGDAIVLPAQSVNSRGELFLVNQSGRLELARVEVLRREREWLVARGEVPDGSLVCTTRLEGAVPGMAVEVVEVAAPAVEDRDLLGQAESMETAMHRGTAGDGRSGQ